MKELEIINKLKNIAVNLDNKMRTKHVCAIYDKNRLISIGYNKRKTSVVQYLYQKRNGCPYRIYNHAEVECLSRDMVECFKQSNKRVTLYSVRVDKNNHLKIAKPCSACYDLIVNTLIVKRIVYSISDNQFGIIEIR
jgi:deoxycytidylate deaminase